MRTRAILVIVGALLFMLGSTGIASASQEVGKADPNDTSGPLDLSGVGMQLKNSGKLFVGVRTFARWNDSLLNADGQNRILFYFNTDRDTKFEYIGTVSTVDGTMQMMLKGKRELGPYTVTRIDATTIKVGIPPDTPVSRPSVKLFAKSKLTGSGTCSNTCVDRAPDTGALAF